VKPPRRNTRAISAYAQYALLSLQMGLGKVTLATMFFRLVRARVTGRSIAAALAHVSTCRLRLHGTKRRHGHPAALPGAGASRNAWGGGAYCPCAARLAAERFIWAGSAHFSNLYAY
jgi:hypothetical protein